MSITFNAVELRDDCWHNAGGPELNVANGNAGACFTLLGVEFDWCGEMSPASALDALAAADADFRSFRPFRREADRREHEHVRRYVRTLIEVATYARDGGFSLGWG